MEFERLDDNLFGLMLSYSSKEEILIQTCFDQNLPISSLRRHYQIALERKFLNVARYIYWEKNLRSEFSYMLELSDEWAMDERLSKVRPLFTEIQADTYDEVLTKIFKKQDIRKFRKRIGIAITKYGSSVLNNLMILSEFTDIEKNLDLLLSSDHGKMIPEPVCSYKKIRLDQLRNLLSHLGARKVLKVLVSFDRLIVNDIFHMMGCFDRYPNEDYINNIRRVVGSSPKSFREIHDKLIETTNRSRAIRRLQLKSKRSQIVLLNQNLEKINGEQVGEYTIYVPQNSHNLEETGELLQHCVGSYTGRVLDGRCKIINLMSNNKPVYTLEIGASRGAYKIKQFRGMKNCRRMEFEEGEIMRKIILNLLDLHYPLNS